MRHRRTTRALIVGSVLAVCCPVLAYQTNATTRDRTGRAIYVLDDRGLLRVPTTNLSLNSNEPSAAGRWNANRIRQAGGGISCVPYARRVSGIEVVGNAWQWWAGAEGRYARGRVPEQGSVLTFRSNGRMQLGHVAVVSRVINAREIEIDHANWANRGSVARSVPVVDVSPANNWTAVRVGLGRSPDFGSVYPTYGFIYDRPDNGVLVAQDAAPAPAPALNPIPADLRPVAERPWQMYEEVAEAPARANNATARPATGETDRR